MLAALAGVVVVLWTLMSALQTVVVPRATPVTLTRVHFRVIRQAFDLTARPSRGYDTRDRVLAVYAPLSLLLLPGVWIVLITLGFAAVFWASGVDPFSEAFAISGSSVLTLGYERPDGIGREMLSFLEAAFGLGVLTLMISYLPSIYSAFRTREALVGMLEVRAGTPPTPAVLLIRYADIDGLDRIDEDLFQDWERWFVDVEESHTSQGSLAFFRSPTADRSWITAAGCVLDTASLYRSTVVHPAKARPDLLIRSGFACLRRLADFYGIPFDPDPAPTDPISITRDEFDAVCTKLAAAHVPLYEDLDQAWKDFAGWRVNYDTVLLALASLVEAPYAPWSSDRAPTVRPRPPLRRPRPRI